MDIYKDKLRLCATAAFGVEATLKRELQRLGFEGIAVSDGRVDFQGDLEGIARANLWLRSANRVMLVMGEFEARSFDELFEGTKALPWGDWIGREAMFSVSGKSVRSGLYSVPDCQAIVKKAIVEKLRMLHTDVEWFAETGPKYNVQVSILKDIATITIDTTGSSLHMRGYRKVAAPAPIKETLAAALIELSYWRPGRVLMDGVCGSGTIPIEAAMIARNIAPGSFRRFVCEAWPQMPAQIWVKERERANGLAVAAREQPLIFAGDISAREVQAAMTNAEAAGVFGDIRFGVCALGDAVLPAESGIAIMNPPFGERMASASQAAELYRIMGRLFADDNWSVYVLTSDEDFERHYGKKADKKRKLFSGMIKTDYYQFHGKKP